MKLIRGYASEHPIMAFAMAFFLAAILVFVGGAVGLADRLAGLLGTPATWLHITFDAVFILAVGAATGRILSSLVKEHSRNRKELALEASLLDAATDSIFAYRPDGSILYANEAAHASRGYSREEMMRMNRRDLVIPEHARAYQVSICDVVEKRELRYEGVHLRKDGTQMPVEIYARLVSIGDEEVILGVCRDITTRKEIEERLQQSERKYATLVEQARDGITIVQDGVVVYSSPAMCSTLGFESAEVVGRPFLDFIAPDVRQMVASQYERGVSGKQEPGYYETKLARKDGAHVAVEVNWSFIEYGSSPAIMAVIRDITERKAVEDVLKASEQRLKDAQADGRIGHWEYDLATGKIEWSDQAFELYERSPALGAPTVEEEAEYYSPEQTATLRETGRQVIATGQPCRFDLTVRLPGGKTAYFSATMRLVCDPSGQPEKLFGTVHDITARKAAEESLKLERENFRNSLEMSPLGIQVVDAEGEVVYVNRALLNMWGYDTREELIAVPLRERVTPETYARIETVRDTSRDGRFVADYEAESSIVRKDGSVRHLRTLRKEITWNGRKCSQILFEDITDGKIAEQKIERAAREWRTTFDSITDMISIHDNDNRLIRVNRPFARAFGTTPAALLGMPCHQVVHGTENPPEHCPHRKTLKSGEPSTREVYQAENGVWIQESTSPVLGDQGQVVATVHIMKDVTERKQMEQQLLMTERLATIGELVSGIAHELNNPLTGVIGFSQLLMEREVADDIKDDLTLISGEAQRAARIVRNLLTFARKHAPVKQPSQINAILDDVLRLRSYEHQVNNIQVVRRCDPDLPEIMADYFQVQQVFLNIIINAEYFMLESHGGGTLTITTQRTDCIVRASFTDDGPGISPRNMPRLFDPFFTTKEVGKGTGLGLSICHGIVTEHGGRIYARSEPGKGTTFVVELPVDGANSNRKDLKHAERTADPADS